MTSTPTSTDVRAELMEALARRRTLLRRTVRGLTDAQAAHRPTASRLCLGGLVKHVTAAERKWVDFIVGGPEAPVGDVAEAVAEHERGFEMAPGETLAGLLAEYERTGERTDAVVAALPDLDITHPLPEAPWYEPGARWSARSVLLHIITETAQHAGHADILRETIDGRRSM